MTKELQPLSVISDMADKYGMDKRAFEATVRQTCMPSKTEITNEQFAAFLLVAKKYDLNPFTKEIFAFPSRSWGIQPVVSVDGWVKIINSHPAYDGVEFYDLIENGKLISVTAKIHRKDRTRPTECTEYMSECTRPTDTWKTWPRRMLRHKALIQSARYAFGFSDIIDPDEAERYIGMSDVTPKASVLSEVIAKAKEAKQSGAKVNEVVIEEVKEEQPSLFVEEPIQHVVEDVAYNAALASIMEAKGANDLDQIMLKMDLDSFPLEVQDNLQKASERKFEEFKKTTQKQKGE